MTATRLPFIPPSNPPRHGWRLALAGALLVSATLAGCADSASSDAGTPVAEKGLLAEVPNADGASATLTLSQSGQIDLNSPFFQAFGNGRSCASCHQADAGWSITPESLAARFAATDGLDPVFRLVDGATSPQAPVGTVEERLQAYNLLLQRGLIRVGLPIPPDAEFELIAVDDPYRFASATELSLFRRPLPATNLKFQTSLMWDGRETPAVSAPAAPTCLRGVPVLTCYLSLDDGLLNQSNDAVRGHAQAMAGIEFPVRRSIVDFEVGQFTAQVRDLAAGSLTALGARGGPGELSRTPFYFGINDVAAGDYQSGRPFDPQVMKLFGSWLQTAPQRGPAVTDPAILERRSIARGERLFNTRQFAISGVPGFNDDIGVPVVQGTCSSCHSTPNVGTHSVPRLMNTGIADAARRRADVPLYTLRHRVTGATVSTTDPGAALQSGRWNDIGKMKVPSLRGIESRSPYFHDGSENDVAEIARFYDRRFQIGLSADEIRDLAAFLKVL